MDTAVFHYPCPALAVLLFARIDVLGVAWFRIASAAVVFAAWRRPWRLLTGGDRQRSLFLTLGVVLAAMNTCFYLAIARLPLAVAGARTIRRSRRARSAVGPDRAGVLGHS